MSWPFLFCSRSSFVFLGCRKWGCNKWGLKGCLPSLPGNRPKSAFFALFRRPRTTPGKSRKRRKRAFFLRYPQICLNPHLLNPHLRHSNFFSPSPFGFRQFTSSCRHDTASSPVAKLNLPSVQACDVGSTCKHRLYI